MLLSVLVHTLHAHQLLTGEAILLIVCVRMLSANEGVHRLRVVFETGVGVGSETPRLLVRGGHLLQANKWFKMLPYA